jgi:hypothetical protein
MLIGKIVDGSDGRTGVRSSIEKVGRGLVHVVRLDLDDSTRAERHS